MCLLLRAVPGDSRIALAQIVDSGEQTDPSHAHTPMKHKTINLFEYATHITTLYNQQWNYVEKGENKGLSECKRKYLSRPAVALSSPLSLLVQDGGENGAIQTTYNIL